MGQRHRTATVRADITRYEKMVKQKACAESPLLSARKHMITRGWCEGCPGLNYVLPNGITYKCHEQVKDMVWTMKNNGFASLADRIAKRITHSGIRK